RIILAASKKCTKCWRNLSPLAAWAILGKWHCSRSSYVRTRRRSLPGPTIRLMGDFSTCAVDGDDVRSPMKIDAHQHFWRHDPERDAWITPEMAVLKRDFLPSDLCTELHANGIDACVAVQAAQSDDETHFLLELADHFPVIAGVVGWVDFRADSLPE